MPLSLPQPPGARKGNSTRLPEVTQKPRQPIRVHLWTISRNRSRGSRTAIAVPSYLGRAGYHIFSRKNILRSIENQENVLPISQEKLQQEAKDLQFDRQDNTMIGNQEGLSLLKSVEKRKQRSIYLREIPTSTAKCPCMNANGTLVHGYVIIITKRVARLWKDCDLFRGVTATVGKNTARYYTASCRTSNMNASTSSSD